MNRWEEQLKNHPIHETLEWIKDCADSKVDDLDEEGLIEKRRLIKYVSYHEEVLKVLDSEVTPFNQLDSLNNQLRSKNIAPQLEAYKANGNVQHLKNANDQISNLLTQLSLLLSISNENSQGTPLKELEKFIDSTNSSLVQKKEDIQDSYEQLSQSISTSNQKLSELQESIKAINTQMNTQVSEWQSQFSSAQESRSKSFNQWRDEFTSEKNSELEHLAELYEKETNDIKEKFVQRLGDILKDGKAKHEAILDLYQITAGDSVAAGYLKSANEEKKQADFWRLVAIGFIMLTVCWLLYSYTNIAPDNFPIGDSSETTIAKPEHTKQTPSKEAGKDATKQNYSEISSIPTRGFPWHKLFLAFSISGVLLWGSAYSAQQSTKHRRNERRTRWFALEVKAIDPFISTLDDAEQKELKKQLSERIFGQFLHDDDNSSVVDEHALKIVADSIGGILSKLPKNQ